jgi:putative ABC transport system permease protein
MRKVALRGLFARKLRLVLTALAVALGVTLIAGTYVFTDTINRSFDRIFTESNKGTDASITPRKTIDTSNNGGTQPTIPPSVLAQVRRQPGVQTAGGSVFDVGTVLGKDGKRIGKGGAPNFIASIADQPRFEAFTIKQGRRPQNADEVTIDASTARKQKLKLGDKLAVVATAPRKDYTVVGFTQIAGVDSFGGATVVDMLLPEAQRMLGKSGFDQVQVSAKPGVSPEELRHQLRTALPRTVDVRTGQEEARKQSDDIRNNLSFLTTALLAFAGISLFVGAFIIFNTFSITVTQRMREFALLRTLGASRGQVMRSVITEGLTIGVLGSLVGLGLGLAVASGLRALFRAVGVDLPSNGNVIASRTIIVSLVVGTVVTVLSSLAPALRATRVPPVEALREGAVPTTRGPSRKVTAAGALLGAIGIALMCVGLFASLSSNAALSFVGGGAGATFLGVALVSPYLVRPLASLVGRPFERTRGITGRLARENTVRQPGRTAVTAAALMVGVALVTFVSIFAAGAKETIAKAVDDNLKAAFVVQNTDGFSPFSPKVLPAVERVDGVSETSPARFSQAKIRGVKGNQPVSGIDPRTFSDLYGVSQGEAALRSLGPGVIAVSKKFAEDNKVKTGETLNLTTAIGRKLALRVNGIVDDKGGFTTALIVTNQEMVTQFGEPKDAFGMVGVRPGADRKAVQADVKRVLDRQFPEAEVLTAKEFKDKISGNVDQLLSLIYALLALSVIVSLFGIVNTLVLSISERTRELGLLRAVGTTRRQVKRIVRYEAVITSLIGGVLGIVVGAVLAVLFTQPLDNFTLKIPIVPLLFLFVLAGIAGVGAAVLPARRASRLDVLDALAYE